MLNLAIYGRLTKTTNPTAVRQFYDALHRSGVDFRTLDAYADELTQAGILPENDPRLVKRFANSGELMGCQFLLSLGGDGTMLDALRFIHPLSIPLVGVNLGRLGFLTTATQDELPQVVQGLLDDTWKLEERSLLEIRTEPHDAFGGHCTALNDITLHKANSNEMIVVHCFVNGEFLNTYWTDGLILSTPTGSTAYSLACGGPIMLPRADVFLLTPIAPHSLTVRPVVLPDDAVVSFEIESRSGQAYIALDSRTEAVPNHTRIAVRKSQRKAQLVRVNAPSFFATLRERLNWGLDARS